MAIPRTRAEARAARSALFTATFWADLTERVVTSAAGGALAVAAATGFDLTSPVSWAAVGVGAGTAALVSLFKGIIAARSGSASLVPGV